MRLILALLLSGFIAWPAHATSATTRPAATLATPAQGSTATDSPALAPAAVTPVPSKGLSEALTGQPAPDFAATDTMNHPQTLSSYKGKVVVLEWTNNLCPYVQKHYNAGNMQSTQQAAADMGAIWLRIISSAPGKEGHVSPADANRIVTEKHVIATATILDESGSIGKLYGAKATPTMAVIDANGTLVYEGAIDDKPTSDPDDIATAKNYVKTVLADLKAGRKVSIDRTQAYGCGVKYAD
jgi:peroxiredoxin